MAGTTVADGGLVTTAFSAALDELGVSDPEQRTRFESYVLETMGTSKIDVFPRCSATRQPLSGPTRPSKPATTS